MNFDFSDEQKMFADHLGQMLANDGGTAATRAALTDDGASGRAVLARLAGLGALGVAVPEAYGGLGLGYLELCIVAEQLGGVLSPAPIASTIYLFADLLVAAASHEQKARLLPPIVAGDTVATVAFAERPGNVLGAADRTTLTASRLTGTKLAVLDGMIADVALVSADGPAGAVLALVTLDQPGVTRIPTASLDPTRPLATLAFDNVEAEPCGPDGQGRVLLEATLTRGAVPLAFEAVAGAEAALALSLAFARERQAFGQPIGAFQAIKHKLADVYVDGVLARSNAYHAAWALSSGAEELPLAAAIARISATKAFDHAARECIQTHGGIGFTWEADPHLFYRRAAHLGRIIGGEAEWSARAGRLLAATLPEVSIARISRPWQRAA